ncbi:UDP-4-amino-4,6-dideoxy-N-acetyl-beta-L-altrosamine transaminase [Novispirillum itersonii]|uniref:UDP-4-amino-4, 6-dideoxy-N-acetyl-beta-L-altrosamine transaminase n=1 Tax=Novispirillum itersonii TaxID=189 RepID=UPI00035E8FE2|nr:UDP-4-amino-4,6-dideoxy-N-acetyl-beta-L-altrosamine transaminase [Novispirillum itersonii]
MTGQAFLPYGRQDISEDDIAAVSAVLRSDFLTTGPMVDAFEAALASRVGAPHAVVCANGTAALHLALAALRLEADGRACAIVPSITFVATANMARAVGLEVVFSDVDPDTALMTADTLAEAFERAKLAGLTPKVVLPVHFAGQSPDMAALAALAAAEGCVIIDDAAHAVGTVSAGGYPVGGSPHAVMTCFSFHPVKTIAMGEGGAVTTRDPALAEALRRLRGHGLTRDPSCFENTEDAFTDGATNPWYYEMPDIGFNYRATDLQCALGLSQMKRLDTFIARRAALIAEYGERLKTLSQHITLLPPQPGQTPAWHLAVALIDFAAAGISRAAVMATLRSHGVGTQVHYIPVHRQPYYTRRWPDLTLPDANRYYQRCLSLPLYPALTAEDMDRVCHALTAALRGPS